MTNHLAQTPLGDRAKRVLRTLIQVGVPSFLSLAAGLPTVIVQVQGVLSPRLYALLVSTAAAITAAATVLAWIMGNPTVNAALGVLGLAGSSTIVAPADTETRALLLADVNRALVEN